MVEFAGRMAELTDLLAWCSDDAAGRLRLVTGPGGVGKTRLALQLAARLRELGWRCEWVGDRQEANVLADIRAVNSGRLLLIVDYAETRIGLAELLRAITADVGAAIRVLLLARSAGQWWEQLGAGEGAIRDLVGAAGWEGSALREVLDDDLTDEEQVQAAVPVFAAALGVKPPGYVIVAPQARRARVLELHAAALVAVLEWIAAPGTQVRVELGGVLGELLRHEERFWLGSAQAMGLLDGPAGMTPSLLRQVVAAGCLLGAADRREALALLDRVPEARRSVKLAEWLRELYPPDPGSGEWLGVMQPDRLAERLVVGQLGESPELARACLTDLGERQARRAVLLLARAASEDDIAEQMLVRLLPLAARVVEQIDAPLETLVSIANAIPYPSVVLAAAHAAITQRILDKRPVSTHPAERARWLTTRGNALAQLGQLGEAFPVTEEAVSLYRELVAGNPDRYRPELAGSLSNLGGFFSGLGHPTDALTTQQEAVGIFRDLAVANPSRYQPDLARSLSNLGVFISRVGQSAEALTVEEEAVSIFRDLAAVNPDRYQPRLADALSNLGVRCSELDRPADALAADQEAVSIYRGLAASNPDRYRPDLARALSNLGTTLSTLGRPVEALPVEQEAVSMYRHLAVKNPDGHRPDLARSLFNLGILVSGLGRSADALAADQEAADIYRGLAASNPDRYRPDLADALSNLGVRLSGRPAEAVTAEMEAVNIYRDLTASNPDRYGPDLARSVSNLGATFSALGHRPEALTAVEEAVGMYRHLAVNDPDGYRPDLADSLSQFGGLVSGLGRPAEALAAEEEAVSIYRDLAAVNSERYLPSLAASLSNFAATLKELGRHAEAAEARTEVDRLRQKTKGPRRGRRHRP